jgi:hypothetical protein
MQSLEFWSGKTKVLLLPSHPFPFTSVNGLTKQSTLSLGFSPIKHSNAAEAGLFFRYFQSVS